MLIIDRFEGEKAVIEFSRNEERFTFDIPKVILPEKAEAGDVVELKINKDTTKNRKERIEKLSDELFE